MDKVRILSASRITCPNIKFGGINFHTIVLYVKLHIKSSFHLALLTLIFIYHLHNTEYLEVSTVFTF